MFDIHYISEHYNLLFILYLLIFVGYLEKLIGCHVEKFVSNNIYLKHLIGLFCLIFLVILVESKKKYTDEYMFFTNLSAQAVPRGKNQMMLFFLRLFHF